MTSPPWPDVARTRAELDRALSGLRGSGSTVALVPTMGALHEGHLSLIRAARERADAVVVSIFVNPLQFGPGEDFERYPRSFDSDLAACRNEGVAAVFTPPVEVVYPTGPAVRVCAGEMGERWEGASRPGHFDGVLTVVLKLINLVRPDVAVFGRKDAQQLALVRRMVHDLDAHAEIASAPIVRDPDGLALSSRNAYLSRSERASALALPRALSSGAGADPGTVAAGGAPAAGIGGAEDIRRRAMAVLSAERGVELDYLALVEPETFAEVGTDYTGPAVLAVAGLVGGTRLIDNVDLTVRPAAATLAGRE